MPFRTPTPSPDSEPIVVLGHAHRTLDLLRLAVLRGDNITAVTAQPGERTRRFIDSFAVEWRDHAPSPDDLEGAGAALIGIGDVEAENELVRAARRRGIPVYVAERPLVSDFTPLEWLEQRPFACFTA